MNNTERIENCLTATEIGVKLQLSSKIDKMLDTLSENQWKSLCYMVGVEWEPSYDLEDFILDEIRIMKAYELENKLTKYEETFSRWERGGQVSLDWFAKHIAGVSNTTARSYIDDGLRIHRKGEGNIKVTKKDWEFYQQSMRV